MNQLHLIFLLFVPFCFADELISTRCQAKCLYDMEKRYEDNSEMRRNLKHHMVNMCKDDANCSACTLPCRETFSTVESCRERDCKDARDREHCEKSCEFLQSIFSEKPGACPKIKDFANDECTAECHLDGDCEETAKCCSYGCSRRCKKPNRQDNRILPIPIEVSVQERKRKRSAVVRWSLKGVSSDVSSLNSNLYIVQWRWSIHSDESSMTQWETVVVKNKQYAILKHLLSPGRFYQFRVGSVNVYGSLGFSTPSQPFKLSKEARAPSAPRQVSLGETKMVGKEWTQIVTWTQPISDLPIKNYQVSWALSNSIEADSFEEQMRRQSIVDSTHQTKRHLDDDEGLWTIEDRDRLSVIVPSHSTNTEIPGLRPNSVYIVEVHATVDSSEGELHGEKGVVFARTGGTSGESEEKEEREEKETVQIQEATPTHNTVSHLENVPTLVPQNKEKMVDTLDIQIPFYDGNLQTTVNWLNSMTCSPIREPFVVRIRKESCENEMVDGMWHDTKVFQCSTVLRDLSFQCTYSIEVSRIGEIPPSLIGTLRTVECPSVPSPNGAQCPITTVPQISCHVFGHIVKCHWHKNNAMGRGESTIGYRVVLSSPSRDLNNITINPPQLREIRFESLEQNTNYILEVQPITNRGLGDIMETSFQTGIHETYGLIGEEHIQRYPGGEIIELPLESTASYSTLITVYCIILSVAIALL